MAFSGLPVACLRKSMVLDDASISRLAKWSYKNNPMRIIQTGRADLALVSCGITKRSGHMMWGALFNSTSRSASDLRTMANS